MLEHLNSSALPPRRVVILGAHGFVGAASARLMAAHGVPVLALGRAEADLLAAGPQPGFPTSFGRTMPSW